MVCCDGSAFTTGRLTSGRPVRPACVVKPFGCVTTCMPEITLTSDEACMAFNPTTTSATRWVGLSTHTRRTVTSPVPKPTVTCPSTKFVLEDVMSTAAEDPAGSDEGLMAVICGPPVAGYV